MQSRQICQLASYEAKGGTGMVALAGQYLNVVLEDLKRNRNLKINRVTQMITVQPMSYGPFPLEADYLRSYDVFYPLPTAGGATQSSETQFLIPITMEQFDAEFKFPAISNYPYEYATDLSTQAQVWSGGSQGVGTLTSAGNFFIYPQCAVPITLTHRYMKDQPDLASPETSSQEPWFAHTDYLIHATASRLMGITGDARQAQYFQESEAMLKPYLIMQGDEQAAVVSVRLDPRHFRFTRGLKPTKALPFIWAALFMLSASSPLLNYLA